ncbi:MAG: hypothetical protein ACXWAT_00045 [Methylobacter sp.]
MPILIEHPNHGRMHVYNNTELEYHKTIGWSEVVDKPVVVKPNKSVDKPVVESAEEKAE